MGRPKTSTNPATIMARERRASLTPVELTRKRKDDADRKAMSVKRRKVEGTIAWKNADEPTKEAIMARELTALMTHRFQSGISREYYDKQEALKQASQTLEEAEQHEDQLLENEKVLHEKISTQGQEKASEEQIASFLKHRSMQLMNVLEKLAVETAYDDLPAAGLSREDTEKFVTEFVQQMEGLEPDWEEEWVQEEKLYENLSDESGDAYEASVSGEASNSEVEEETDEEYEESESEEGSEESESDNEPQEPIKPITKKRSKKAVKPPKKAVKFTKLPDSNDDDLSDSGNSDSSSKIHITEDDTEADAMTAVPTVQSLSNQDTGDDPWNPWPHINGIICHYAKSYQETWDDAYDIGYADTMFNQLSRNETPENLRTARIAGLIAARKACNEEIQAKEIWPENDKKSDGDQETVLKSTASTTITAIPEDLQMADDSDDKVESESDAEGDDEWPRINGIKCHYVKSYDETWNDAYNRTYKEEYLKGIHGHSKASSKSQAKVLAEIYARVKAREACNEKGWSTTEDEEETDEEEIDEDDK